MIDNIKFFVRNGNNVVRYSGEITEELEKESDLKKLSEELKIIANEKTKIPIDQLNIDFYYRVKT